MLHERGATTDPDTVMQVELAVLHRIRQGPLHENHNAASMSVEMGVGQVHDDRQDTVGGYLGETA